MEEGAHKAVAGVVAPRHDSLSTGDVLLDGRYRILRRLGEGGMGVVYEAMDRVRESTVALKTLARVDATGVYRLKSEFRSLADVAHPNLVRLHELHAEGHRWFFTMELVEGQSFIEHVRRSPAIAFEKTVEAVDSHTRDVMRPAASGAFDEPKLRACFAELVTGVAAIHTAGKLHRDLKPSNILVTEQGHVVVLDFGLASDDRESEDAPGRTLVEEGVSGTPGYMAPEQCRAERATPASDWYAVGVVLFEALTGRLPFEGTTMQVLLAKQNSEAPTPRSIVADVPDDLNRLCIDLLRRAPAERPSGAEVRARLGSTSNAPPAPIAHAIPFVGRKRELEQLEACARVVDEGRPAIALVSGPSGIGKSTVLDHFLKRMRAAGAVVLSGRCYEREAVPFKAFDGVIDSLTRHLRRIDPVDAAAVLPRNIGALCRIFPVLSRVDVIARTPQRGNATLDAHQLREAGFSALKEVLIRLCDRRRLVLSIDDLQWADRDSFRLLEAILTTGEVPPVLIVGTCRDGDDGQRGAFLGELLDPRRGLTEVTVRTITVNPLDDTEIVELAHALAPDGGIDAARLASESRGNPFVVEELVRFATRSGETGVSFAEVFRARLLSLPDDARKVLEVLAVAARPLPIGTVAATCGLDVASIARAFDALVAGGLAHTVGGSDVGALTMALHHDRVREAVTEMLSEEQLRALHVAMATALESGPDEDAETASHHALAAGDLDRASRYACKGAQRARDNLAFERAAVLYRRAIDHGSDAPDTRLRLLVELAETLVLAGRDADAGRVYLEASQIPANAENAPLVRESRRRAAEQLVLCGELERGVEVLSSVLADIGVSLPHSTGRSLLAFLWDRLMLKLRGLSWTPRDESTVSTTDIARLEAYNVVAASLALVHPIVGLQFQARLLRLALRVGVGRYVVIAFGMYGLTLALSGIRGFRRGKPLLAEAQATAATLPPELRPRYTGLAHGTEGVAALCVGRYVEAREKLGESVASFEERAVANTGEQVSRNNIRLLHLATLIAAGGIGEAMQKFDELLRDAKRRGDLHLEASATRLLNQIYLFRADPAGARAALGALHWKPLHGHFDLQRVYELRAQIGIDLYEDTDEILTEKYRADFKAFDRSLIRTVEIERLLVTWSRARALLHDAERDVPGALRGAERACRILLRAEPAYARIYGSLIAAAIAWQRSDSDAAARLLNDAIRIGDDTTHTFEIFAARARLSKLLGGDEGERLALSAREWAEREGIVNADQMFRATAPGFDRRTKTN
jgi:eukaryotic-like serine/threonine-protein kinase